MGTWTERATGGTLGVLHSLVRRGPFRGRGQLLRLARLLARNREVDVRVWPGVRLRLDFRSTYEMSLFMGSYEPELARLIVGLLSPGDTFVDGGANVGYYSLLAANRIGPSGRVVAFEPDPATRARAVQNCRLNPALAERISLSALGLYSREQRLGLAQAGDRGLESHLVPRETEGAKEIALTTLDATLGDAPVRGALVIKLDLEGAEHHALRGAESVLGKEAILICELNDTMLRRQGSSVPGLLAWLSSRGFRAFTERGEPLPVFEPGWPPWTNGIFARHPRSCGRIESYFAAAASSR